MLESDKQLRAYTALVAAGGLIAPASASVSSQSAGLATDASSTLSSLILNAVAYPSTVTGSTGAITLMANELMEVAATATDHASLVTQYCDPSSLIRLSIGWDVFCRANNLPESELSISVAIGESTIPDALVSALRSIDLQHVTDAMTSINTTLSGAGEGGVTPPLTSEQITALDDAVMRLQAEMVAVSNASNDLRTWHQHAIDSALNADDAYNNAISVALISSAMNSNSISTAVSAITPQAVLNILKEDD